VAFLGGRSLAAEATPRQTISLDGAWQIAEGTMEQIPAEFSHKVPVPGLADMAVPAFAEVGTDKSNSYRQAFWYRRTFTLDGPATAVARLKIHKAMYGTRVYLNGRLVGDHLPCFTPAEFDIAGLLAAPGRPNELVVRVGAHRTQLPKGMPDGWDFEKILYTPGIYDTVELILSGKPRIVNVQAVPELDARAVRVVTEMEGEGLPNGKVVLRVREAVGGKEVGALEVADRPESDHRTVDVRVPIANCRFWSPEDPFLYELDVSTGADTLRTRFGMRTFRLDAKTGRAMLNGKPYFLRGTNVCIFRFFEDPLRDDLPWRETWVRRLHRVFRSMHWNSMRYCIGFPPEPWYRIADEEGLMIQNEFPIWYGSNRWPADLKSPELVKEYTEWMREQWNHPSVVIWDAQNETETKETGKAIRAVRGLDLSGRPWDNGWATPQDAGDSYEAHPYLFYDRNHRLSLLKTLKIPPGQPGAPLSGNPVVNRGNNAVIINEYGWLWLNRDGSPTTISQSVYPVLLPPNATAAQRRELYARLLAAKTEFWRARRQVAGVLHFAGLDYSRPGGQTSDCFRDIRKLEIEPNFARYVGDAFAPLGVMLDFWDEEASAGQTLRVPICVTNDRDVPWQGTVRLQLLRDGQVLGEESRRGRVAGLGSQSLPFAAQVPADTGHYQLVATISGGGEPPVRSLRDFDVLTADQRAVRYGIAVGKPATASSSTGRDGATTPAAAVDSLLTTRWSSEFSDPQWIAVDLEQPVRISRVELVWEGAYGKAYAIQVSDDGKVWKDVYGTRAGNGGTEVIRFKPVEARWVRMYGTRRGTPYGYSLWEFRVFRQ
jgi:hypothetical protein